MYVLSLVEIILYFGTFFGAFAVIVPLGLLQSSFQGECVLYASVNWTSDYSIMYQPGAPGNCYYGIGIQAVGGALFSLGMIVFRIYILVKMSRSETWMLIFLLIHAVLTVLMFVSSCIISVGFKQLCDSFMTKSWISSCSEVNDLGWTLQNGFIMIVDFYSWLYVCQIATWIDFLLWSILLALGIFSLVKGRRQIPYDYLQEDNTFPKHLDEVTPITLSS